MAKRYDVWVPPKQRPIRVGPPATRRQWLQKEFGPLTLRVGRLVCALYHNSQRDAQLIPHDEDRKIGYTYLI